MPSCRPHWTCLTVTCYFKKQLKCQITVLPNRVAIPIGILLSKQNFCWDIWLPCCCHSFNCCHFVGIISNVVVVAAVVLLPCVDFSVYGLLFFQRLLFFMLFLRKIYVGVLQELLPFITNLRNWKTHKFAQNFLSCSSSSRGIHGAHCGSSILTNKKKIK